MISTAVTTSLLLISLLKKDSAASLIIEPSRVKFKNLLLNLLDTIFSGAASNAESFTFGPRWLSASPSLFARRGLFWASKDGAGIMPLSKEQNRTEVLEGRRPIVLLEDNEIRGPSRRPPVNRRLHLRHPRAIRCSETSEREWERKN